MEFGGGSVVAQSYPKFGGIPIISLDIYIENLADNFVKNHSASRTSYGDGWMSTGFVYGYKENPNQYTQADTEKAIELARNEIRQCVDGIHIIGYTREQLMEQINSIPLIEVDEHFNIIKIIEEQVLVPSIKDRLRLFLSEWDNKIEVYFNMSVSDERWDEQGWGITRSEAKTLIDNDEVTISNVKITISDLEEFLLFHGY